MVRVRAETSLLALLVALVASAAGRAEDESCQDGADLDIPLDADTPCQGRAALELLQHEFALRQKTNDHLPQQKSSEAGPATQLLYVGIMSAPSNKEKRDAVRSSYLKALRQKYRDGDIRAEFIIGHSALTNSLQQGALATPKDMQLEHDLAREAEVHGDIRRIALPERYMNLPDKVLQFFELGAALNYKFMMKIDDDQEVDMNATRRFLAQQNSSKLLYAGRYFWPKEKYPSQKGPDGSFVPYFGGPCYLLSQRLARQITQEHSAHTAQFVEYGSTSEDVDMGRWVQWEKTLGGKVYYKNFPKHMVKFLAQLNNSKVSLQ